MIPGLLGNLKLHLHEANLRGMGIDFLSPFVVVRINGREEISAIIEGGGSHPVWTLQFFNFEVIDMNHMIEIIVKDKDMMGSEILGRAEVPMGFLAKPMGA
jgi:hypothetical protein